MIIIAIIIAIFFLCFAIYQISLSLNYLFYVIKLVSRGKCTQGKVVDFEAKKPHKKAKDEYFLIIQFFDEKGKLVLLTDWQAEYHPPLLELNKIVNIIYHPNRPEYAAINDFWHLWIIPAHSIFLGALSLYLSYSIFMNG